MTKKLMQAKSISAEERQRLIEFGRKDGETPAGIAAMEVGVICQNYIALVQYGQRLGKRIREVDGKPQIEDLPFKEISKAYGFAKAFIDAFGETVGTSGDVLRRLRWLEKQVRKEE